MKLNRAALVHQAVVNALRMEMAEINYTRSMSCYANERFFRVSPIPRLWIMALPWGFENMVKAHYRKLVGAQDASR